MYFVNQLEASQIVADDFETGNLDNWTETSTGTGNDVAINSNSPLFGLYDIKVTANSQAGQAYLASSHSSSYTDYYVRLYVTVPSTFSMVSGDLFFVAAIRVSAGAKIKATIGFGRNATSSAYQIQYRATNDAGANIFSTTEDLNFNDGSTHYFEIYYKAAASDPTSGGGAEFKRDGVSKASDFVSNDTDDSAIDELYVGASGLEAGTDGTFQIDQILALTDQYPGAFPGTLTSATVTPASNYTGAQGNVNVSFTMANPIPANGDIQVTFPTTLGSGFDLSNVGTSDVSEASSNGGTLTASVSSNVLTITCGSAINAETAMNLTIQNVINPNTAGSTGTYSIQTRDANDNQIDSGTAAATTIISATSSAKLTNSSGTEQATYLINADRIFVTVTDTDENTNSGSTQTVTCTVTSSSTNDSESLSLTETGNDTAIFRNTGLVINADNSASNNNTTLETRDAATITVSYTDDDDSTDTSSDTATINASTEIISLSTVVSPLTVAVGEAVTYTVTIQNTTSSALTNFKVIAKLASGFAYRSGTATWDGVVLADPTGVDTSTLNFTIPSLDASTTKTLKFIVNAGSNVEPGRMQTSVYAQDQ